MKNEPFSLAKCAIHSEILIEGYRFINNGIREVSEEASTNNNNDKHECSEIKNETTETVFY